MNPQTDNVLRLPAHYEPHLTLNLKTDRRFNLWVKIIFFAVALTAVAVAVGLGLPLESTWSPLLSIPITILVGLCYLAVHEATHGLMMHWRTGVRPTYALKFPFLSTGGSGYLNRGTITLVALAPSVIWGGVLLAALLLAPADLRLTFYIILALNFAASAGDYVEAVVAFRQPREALIRDDGAEIKVFLPAT